MKGALDLMALTLSLSFLLLRHKEINLHHVSNSPELALQGDTISVNYDVIWRQNGIGPAIFDIDFTIFLQSQEGKCRPLRSFH